MIIRSLRLLPYELPLAAPRRTATGVVRVRSGVVLGLCDASGRWGFGDAVVRPSAETGTAARAVRSLAADDRSPVGRRFHDVADVRRYVSAAQLPAGAAYAVELALLDLLAQTVGAPIAALLGEVRQRRVELAAVVETPEEAGAALTAGARALKVKLGGRALEEDLAAVASVREAVGTAVPLRLDANGAWDERAASTALEKLTAYNIEMLEEPLAAPTRESLDRLRHHGVPLALDESLATLPHLVDAVDVAVLKPAALGGVLPCLDLAARARVSVASTAWESAIGRAGALHLAAVLPGPTRVAGLGSPFASDVASWPPAGAAPLTLPDRGLGTAPREAA